MLCRQSYLPYPLVCMYALPIGMSVCKLYFKTLASSTWVGFHEGRQGRKKNLSIYKLRLNYNTLYIQKLRRSDLAYYLPIFCLKIEIYRASFASRERLFQSFAPLYLKLFFRNSVLGLGKAISVSVLLKI